MTAAQQLFEVLHGKTTELAAGSSSVEGGDLEGTSGEGARLPVGDCGGQGVDSNAQAGLELQRVVVPLLQLGRDRLGVAAHHDVALFVRDAAVVGEAVELVSLGVVANLGDSDL